MAHLPDLARSRERVRAVTGLAAILSILFVSSTESSHTHGDGADSPGACSVCQVVHDPASIIVSGTPDVAESNLFRAPALPRDGSNPGIIHLAPRRSRAPPLFISL